MNTEVIDGGAVITETSPTRVVPCYVYNAPLSNDSCSEGLFYCQKVGASSKITDLKVGCDRHLTVLIS